MKNSSGVNTNFLINKGKMDRNNQANVFNFVDNERKVTEEKEQGAENLMAPQTFITNKADDEENQTGIIKTDLDIQEIDQNPENNYLLDIYQIHKFALFVKVVF